jgi:uncharacterized protein
VPVQLGLMAAARRRETDGRGTVNRLRSRRPARQVLLLVLVEVVVGAAVFALTAPVGELLRTQVFPWWPAAWALDTGTHGGFGREALIVTALLMLLGSVIAAPIVEEHYFRGYLLPRMPARLGRGTPLAHAALFAGYHLWTPWLAPTRVLAILPLAYIARRTGDLRIGIVTHVVLNAVDLALLTAFLVTSPTP